MQWPLLAQFGAVPDHLWAFDLFDVDDTVGAMRQHADKT